MFPSALFLVGQNLDIIPYLSAIPRALSQICIIAVVLYVLRGLLWLVNMLFFLPLSDPLRHLPGPSGSMLQNHFREVMDPEMSANSHSQWVQSFGKTFKFHGFGKHDYRLMSFDFRVISHVLSSPTFEKPWQTRTFLGRLIGRGIFSMEGATHKMQRRVIAPAFTSQSIKAVTPVFVQKGEELCDRWKGLVSEASFRAQLDNEEAAGAVIDVAHWISRASFDVIGLAGFGYDFHGVHDESEEVYSAYRKMFNIADKGLGLRGLLELYFPIVRKIWVNDDIRTTNASLSLISRVGKKMVAERKAAYLEAHGPWEGKDILSLLIRSNLSIDPSKRLSDQDLLDQCSTFLLAGSDTVSVALSWCLHLLSLNPLVQSRLRQELRNVLPCDDGNMSDCSADSGFQECTLHSGRPRSTLQPNSACRCYRKTLWESIESLPYLEAVVRESLRICPPVHGTIRVATQDDKIPISHPITLANGDIVQKDDFLTIRKGSYVHIPIEGMSYSEEIWGPDALEFNPDRWKDLQDCVPTKPGVGNLMTFGFGPHSCLGYKFTMAEIKIFIATMLPQLAFSPVEGVKIVKFNSILTRPYVSGQWAAGTQMPLRVQHIK
ncbi:cytochrome P450 [Crassisporium funariophilum]|nr:cytochrome P450 [Crassisporium funariophilum]